MKKFLTTVALGLFCAVGALAQGQKGTNAQKVQPQDVFAVFNSMAAAANTTPLLLVSDASLKPGGVNPGLALFYAPKYDTVQATVTGTPGVCAYQVYGTLKLPSDNPVFPTDYQSLTGALDCTTTAGQMVNITYKPVISVVISLTTLSGGTAPTVQFRFLAAH